MEQQPSSCIEAKSEVKGLPIRIEDDSLIKRTDTALAEAAQLRQSLRQFQDQTSNQVERMSQIGAELDPLLPHPYWELGLVRALLAREEDA